MCSSNTITTNTMRENNTPQLSTHNANSTVIVIACNMTTAATANITKRATIAAGGDIIAHAHNNVHNKTLTTATARGCRLRPAIAAAAAIMPSRLQIDR